VNGLYGQDCGLRFQPSPNLEHGLHLASRKEIYWEAGPTMGDEGCIHLLLPILKAKSSENFPVLAQKWQNIGGFGVKQSGV